MQDSRKWHELDAAWVREVVCALCDLEHPVGEIAWSAGCRLALTYAGCAASLRISPPSSGSTALPKDDPDSGFSSMQD